MRNFLQQASFPSGFTYLQVSEMRGSCSYSRILESGEADSENVYLDSDQPVEALALPLVLHCAPL